MLRHYASHSPVESSGMGKRWWGDLCSRMCRRRVHPRRAVSRPERYFHYLISCLTPSNLDAQSRRSSSKLITFQPHGTRSRQGRSNSHHTCDPVASREHKVLNKLSGDPTYMSRAMWLKDRGTSGSQSLPLHGPSDLDAKNWSLQTHAESEMETATCE